MYPFQYIPSNSIQNLLEQEDLPFDRPNLLRNILEPADFYLPLFQPESTFNLQDQQLLLTLQEANQINNNQSLSLKPGQIQQNQFKQFTEQIANGQIKSLQKNCFWNLQANPELQRLIFDLHMLKHSSKQLFSPNKIITKLFPIKHKKHIISKIQSKPQKHKRQITEVNHAELRQQMKNFPKHFIQTIIKQLHQRSSQIYKIAEKLCLEYELNIKTLLNFANVQHLDRFGSLESIQLLWSQQSLQSKVFSRLCQEIREQGIFIRIVVHSRVKNKLLYMDKVKDMLNLIETPELLKSI